MTEVLVVDTVSVFVDVTETVVGDVEVNMKEVEVEVTVDVDVIVLVEVNTLLSVVVVVVVVHWLKDVIVDVEVVVLETVTALTNVARTGPLKRTIFATPAVPLVPTANPSRPLNILTARRFAVSIASMSAGANFLQNCPS